jgi:hypothetical protein
MTSLKEMSLSYSSKKELTSLAKVSVDLNVQEGTFQANGKDVKFNFVEIDGYKYTVKAKTFEALKRILDVRPQTKFVKFEKDKNGELFVIPLD